MPQIKIRYKDYLMKFNDDATPFCNEADEYGDEKYAIEFNEGEAWFFSSKKERDKVYYLVMDFLGYSNIEKESV